MSNRILVAGLVVTLALAIWGWNTAREAENRVTRSEQADQRAAAVGQVVTCFSAARSRPRLVLIFRFLQNQAATADAPTRQAFNGLLESFTGQATPGITGEPTRTKCKTLARTLGVDDLSYDFDPATGRLLHPQTGPS